MPPENEPDLPSQPSEEAPPESSPWQSLDEAVSSQETSDAPFVLDTSKNRTKIELQAALRVAGSEAFAEEQPAEQVETTEETEVVADGAVDESATGEATAADPSAVPGEEVPAEPAEPRDPSEVVEDPAAAQNQGKKVVKRAVRDLIIGLAAPFVLVAVSYYVWTRYFGGSFYAGPGIAIAAPGAELPAAVGGFSTAVRNLEAEDVTRAAGAPLESTLGQLSAAAVGVDAELLGTLAPAVRPSLLVTPGGRPSGDVPVGRHHRWEIRFNDTTAENYARQLDFFGIELGVIGGSDRVIYLSNLAKAIPEKREGAAADDNRVYLSWRAGPLAEADRELVAKAKVPADKAVIVQFLPQQVEFALGKLEEEFAGRNKEQITKTVFGVKAEGTGFVFHVLEQKGAKP